MNVYILGAATTQFGELWDQSPQALARSAMMDALGSSQLDVEDIDALFVGNMLSGVLANQENLGSLFTETLGAPIPAFRLEGACASGGLALHTAINSVKAGQYETVLVLGVEKMTDHGSEEITKALMSAGSEEERSAGATFPGLYALMARSYMQQYEVTEELLAGVPVKNHYHGSLNPKAQFKKPVSAADVMKSSKIADPLKLLDCSPVSDGAAAVVVTSKKPKSLKPVEVMASEVATDTLSLSKRSSFTSLNAVKLAASRAYSRAGIKPKDVSVVEIHDCFSIAEVMALEDLGFSKAGEGARDVSRGKFTLGTGKTIANPSGGLKACGHPIGATGIKQIAEITMQLRGEAGKRQVPDATIGMTHNVGGSGAIAAIHILKRSSA